MIKEGQHDGVEARYGVEVEEFVKDERWEVGAEMRRVVDCVAGDLLWRNIRSILGMALGRITSQSSSSGKSPAKTPWNLPVALYLRRV